MRKLVFISGGLAGFVLAVALRLVLGGSSAADAQLATAPPAIPVVAATTTAAAPQAAVVAAPVDRVSHFVSDPAQSAAKILVAQTGLLGDSTLVATGSNVAGDVYLTNSGQLGNTPSGFQLDMRTLRSSNSELNSFIKTDLNTAQYPSATFVVESVNGIPANYADGNDFTFTMTGPMTMHGQTRSVTWTVKARQAGDFLTFAADTDFNMTDFGLTPPNYGVARAKNSVHLQVMVVATRAP